MDDSTLLGIDRRLLGFASLSNFGMACSSSRFVMFSNFLGQYIPLDNGEPKIVLSGTEEEFIKTLFSRKVENDSKVLAIIDRYDGRTADRIDTTVERFVIYHDLVKDELNYINIPNHEKFNPKFGFTHRETNALDDIEYGDELPAGTKLSRTNSENERGELTIGLNVNICLASFKDVGEDPIVISDELAERGSFKTYETFRLEFGYQDVPLNLYGDDEYYKIMPDIGEYVNDDGILFATRNSNENGDESLYPALMSNRHLRCPRPLFDKCQFTSKAGGKVIDIKVIKSPKQKKLYTYTQIDQQMEKYVNSMNDFINTFIRTIEEIQAKYNNEIVIGDKLHKMMVDLYSIRDPRLTNVLNQSPLDLYFVEVVVEYSHKLNIGTKMSGLYGD